MGHLIHLFDHSFPKAHHSRIDFFKQILQNNSIEILVSKTRDELKLKVENANSTTLFLVHISEFQFEDLEKVPYNQHAFFIFYSGAGFQKTPSFPTLWKKQILCFAPSVDLQQLHDFRALQQLLTDFWDNQDPISWNTLQCSNRDYHQSSFPLLSPTKNQPENQPKETLTVLQHNMKSLLFLLKKNEGKDQLAPSLYQHWHEDFFQPLNHLLQSHPDYQTSLKQPILEFESWLKKSADQPPDLRLGAQLLNTLRQHITTLLHPAIPLKKDLLDFNRVGRKTEIWVACFHEEWLPQCRELLSHFEMAPHIKKTLGSKLVSKNIYKTYHELIEDLRAQRPEQLLDIYFILICPGSIRPLLNCGHQQQISESWKVDAHSHMGLFSQIVIEFPQLNSHVAFSQENQSTQLASFKDELAISIPDSIEQCHEIITHAFEHHFFDLVYETPKILNSVQNFLQGNRYLFDPTGLRTLFKLRLIANVFAGINDHGELDLKNTLEQRNVIASRLNHLCVAIDEDLNSATFHAYASYRYGWRAWTITTFKEFDHAHLWHSQAKHKLVIRDTDLRFPDINAKEPYRNQFGNTNVRYRLECVHSDLWKHLPKGEDPSNKLDKNWNVRVITANQHQVTQQKQTFHSEEELSKGETYSESRQEFSAMESPQHKLPMYLGIAKPFNSFYDLSQLWSDHKTFPYMHQTLAARLKPPARLMSKSGHFAPYINLPLAEQLLHQVKRCDGQNENGWLLSSILACEADELLLGMSEYSGLEAIRFLHRSEVMAEIESIGLSGRIKINHRKHEINQLVATRYQDDISRQDQFLSRFWDDCRTLYKNSEQFQASEQANVESFSKRKWLHNSPHLGKIEEWLRKGMILCASSLGAWSAFWMISNAVFYILYCLLLEHQNIHHFDFMYQVYISSLIGEPSFGFTESLGEALNNQVKLIVFLHFGCSYILFGFFLSMVYRRITRS